MKISQVTGTPTLPQNTNTGVSPERLARLKAIAAGESHINVTEREEDRDKPQPAPQRTITMRTNQTANRDETPVAAEPTQTGISDTGVQANETAEDTQPLSPQLAALQRQRRALQVKEREIAEREKALSSQPSNTVAIDRIKSSPLSVLQELGVSYDQLTQEILASQGAENPDLQALKAEIAAMKEDVNKTLSEKDAAAERAVLTEIGRNIDRLCAQGDEFEMIRDAKQQEEVVGRIYDHWQKTGEVRDELDVMKEVENELVEEALRYARSKKVQGKLTPQVPLQPQQPTMKTLTNKDSAAPTMSRRQRAIQAALGNLKR